MVILANQRRIEGLHTRVRELIEAAARESDHIRRQHLIDLASAHEHVVHAFEAQVEKEKEKETSPARSSKVTKLPPRR